MNFTPEQMTELKQIFQTKENCDSSMKKQDEKINDLKVEIAAVNTKLKILIYIALAICGGTPDAIQAVVKLIFG